MDSRFLFLPAALVVAGHSVAAAKNKKSDKTHKPANGQK